MMQTLLISTLAIACILVAFGLYGALIMSGRADDRSDAAASFSCVGAPAVDPALLFTPHFVQIESDTAPIVSDDALHHWGEVYTENPQIAHRGVLFETFLRYPEAVLNAVAFGRPALPAKESEWQSDREAWADDEYPIPARDAYGLDATTCDDIHPARLAAEAEQRLARDALDGRLRCRDGAYLEPLHHHRLHPHPESRPHRPWRLTEAR